MLVLFVGGVGTMKETKWRAAIEALRPLGGFGFRVKCLQGPEPPGDHWDGSFPWRLPQPFMVIEWLEIDPVTKLPRGRLVPPEVEDRTAAVEGALRAAGVPFVRLARLIRIEGYLRPGADSG
ncbi:hypothetical protein BH20GEM2_BH20GEM2_03580 [soil metagenome]